MRLRREGCTRAEERARVTYGQPHSLADGAEMLNNMRLTGYRLWNLFDRPC